MVMDSLVGVINSPFTLSSSSRTRSVKKSKITLNTLNPQNQNPNSIPIKPFSYYYFQKFKDFAAKSSNPKWVSVVFPGQDTTELLQNGGTALMSVTATAAKAKISPFVATLAANPTFVSGFCAWAAAQSMKIFFIFNFCVERKWDFRIVFASGGMPSSHSALCTALTTSVAICHGVADSLFPVCLGFSLIVMYDAIGVRRHAGMQAQEGC